MVLFGRGGEFLLIIRRPVWQGLPQIQQPVVASGEPPALQCRTPSRHHLELQDRRDYTPADRAARTCCQQNTISKPLLWSRLVMSRIVKTYHWMAAIGSRPFTYSALEGDRPHAVSIDAVYLSGHSGVVNLKTVNGDSFGSENAARSVEPINCA
ncbi:hypothetical protein TNCV_53311 [Trichonephila clavipes]|nr:hypothetical protein TNCV_53311 [Trichonephila clavipes]